MRRVASSKRSGLKSDLSEQLFGVLAEPGCAPWAAGIERPASRYLRVSGDLVEVEHRLAAHIEPGQRLLPLVACSRLEDRLHRTLRLRRFGVLRLGQVGAAESLTQVLPELRLQGGDAVVAAVLAPVHAIARIPAGEALVASANRLARGTCGKGHREPGGRTVGHRHIDPATLAVALHADQGTEDRDRKSTRL